MGAFNSHNVDTINNIPSLYHKWSWNIIVPTNACTHQQNHDTTILHAIPPIEIEPYKRDTPNTRNPLEVISPL